MFQQPIKRQHCHTGSLSGARWWSRWRITQNFLLSLHSTLRTYRYADGVRRLNLSMAALPPCCSPTLPSLGYFGTVEKLWLTPGRNPLATAIYRERDTVKFASGAYEREKDVERTREGAWRIQSIFWINKLSYYLSHFCPGQIREERGEKRGKQVAAQERLWPDSPFLPISENTHLEIRQADPNWIKSIWILLSLLFPQCTQYYPPFPVTVSWAVCITQLLIKILRR